MPCREPFGCSRRKFAVVDPGCSRAPQEGEGPLLPPQCDSCFHSAFQLIDIECQYDVADFEPAVVCGRLLSRSVYHMLPRPLSAEVCSLMIGLVVALEKSF